MLDSRFAARVGSSLCGLICLPFANAPLLYNEAKLAGLVVERPGPYCETIICANTIALHCLESCVSNQ